MQLTIVFAGQMPLNEHAHHPDDAQDVVGVGVGDVDVVYLSSVDAGPFQLRKHTVASPGVNEQLVAAIVHHEAGVVAVRYEGVAGPQHSYPHIFLSPKSCLSR